MKLIIRDLGAHQEGVNAVDFLDSSTVVSAGQDASIKVCCCVQTTPASNLCGRFGTSPFKSGGFPNFVFIFAKKILKYTPLN
jgi:hypothetical protein